MEDSLRETFERKYEFPGESMEYDYFNLLKNLLKNNKAELYSTINYWKERIKRVNENGELVPSQGTSPEIPIGKIGVGEMTWEEMENRMHKVLNAVSQGYDFERVIRDLYSVQHIKVENGEIPESEFNKKFEDTVIDVMVAEFESTPAAFKEAVRPQLDMMIDSARETIKNIISRKSLPNNPRQRRLRQRRTPMIESVEEPKRKKGFQVLGW